MRCEADLVHDVTWFLLVDGDVYGCLWMVIDVDVYDSGIFFGEAKLEMLTQDQSILSVQIGLLPVFSSFFSPFWGSSPPLTLL